jgi:cell wall-associated NlpC family hydrolase
MAKVPTLGIAALVVALSGCASTGAVPRPFPGSGRESPARPSEGPPFTSNESIAETALAYTGVPYRPGGSDPSGFDCSGFVWFVLQQHGIALPRTVEEQFRVGRPVGARRLAAGDLVFFKTSGRGPTHVGVIINSEEFVHAPTSRGEVRIERLASNYWARRLLAGRRVW